MSIHIIHGIKTKQTNNRLAELKSDLVKVGFDEREIFIYSYGYLSFILSPRMQNRQIAKRILPNIHQGDIIVSHSNGGAITWLLGEMGAPIEGVVLIDPALDEDKAMAPQVKWVQVYYNECDGIVGMSSWLWGHIWGQQGRIGYIPPDARDPRYEQFDVGCHRGKWWVWEHSAVINEKEKWFPLISKRIREKYVGVTKSHV